ncbi:hypothetical protein FGO68_gene2398 [Halteria grandinella]|uniref:Uncharacterized protein n=1 Tax=Halteria grandinella TaxID=5974 RepID=A0A8J8SX32_HALGN|nr:hypothetical protein FGO68_gene2398 [Halteria grandinella]
MLDEESKDHSFGMGAHNQYHHLFYLGLISLGKGYRESPLWKKKRAMKMRSARLNISTREQELISVSTNLPSSPMVSTLQGPQHKRSTSYSWCKKSRLSSTWPMATLMTWRAISMSTLSRANLSSDLATCGLAQQAKEPKRREVALPSLRGQRAVLPMLLGKAVAESAEEQLYQIWSIVNIVLLNNGHDYIY